MGGESREWAGIGPKARGRRVGGVARVARRRGGRTAKAREQAQTMQYTNEKEHGPTRKEPARDGSGVSGFEHRRGN